MKKHSIFRIFLLAFVCILCVSGCGKKDEETPDRRMQETYVQSAEESDAEEAEEAEKAEKVEEPEDVGKTEKAEKPEETEEAEKAKGTQRIPTALSVSGTQLVDKFGNPVQLKGISTHGLSWYPEYVNEACFRQLRDWGVNVVRLAMYTAESGGYCTGGNREDLKALVKEGVEYATNCDMYVIIDWHILSDGNPNTYIEEAGDFFDEMSKEYADYANVLYEICNEPNGGVSWSQIKSYAEQIIPIIRQNDEDGIILVGTPNWSQYVDQTAADPITGYDNIMYTLHFYAATHKDSLRQTMRQANESGLPVFVSEYGICDASGNGAIDTAQANLWVETMDELGISYIAWNLSNKSETSAILKSSCGKTADFASEDLSDSGRWLLEMLGKTGEIGNKRDSDIKAGTESGNAVGSATGSGGNGAEKKEGVSDGISDAGKAASDVSGKNKAESSPASQSQIIAENLEVTAKVINSWEQGEETFYQYELTLSNVGDTQQNGWTVRLEFNHDITVQNSWNGIYETQGNTLIISSMDYNSQIDKDGSVENVGFIIQANGACTLVN